jgi:hypothetical protein
MKKFILPVFICIVLTSYSQDSIKIKQIDSLVKIINQSGFKAERDSIVQDYSQSGMYLKTYITVALDGEKIKKYVNEVHATRVENGSSINTITTNIFYYDKDNIIKVEESAVFEGKEMYADWYYSNDKPLYYTFNENQEKSVQRVEFLLTLGKQLLALFQQGIKNQKP